MTIVSETTVTDSSASNDAAIIYVCITCRRASDPEAEPRPGAVLAAATAQAAEGTGVIVRPIRCLANCTRGPSAAMRCNGSWTYVFGGLDVVCGPALVEGARLLASAADGLMPWRGRPDALKRGLMLVKGRNAGVVLQVIAQDLRLMRQGIGRQDATVHGL